MQKVAYLFFILLSLVIIRAYSQELQNGPQQTTNMSESTNQIQGQLSAENSTVFVDVPGRNIIGLRLETYQPLGQAVFSDQSTTSLGSTGQTLLPTLSYGVLSKSSSLGEFQTTYGLEVTGAFTSQEINLVSGSLLTMSGKLQTSLLSVKPMMRFHWRAKQKIFTRISAEAGLEQLNFNSDSSGSFSRSSGFVGYGMGLEWDPFERYGFILDYYSRIGTSANQNDWSPAASSYQLGAQYFF